MGGLGEAGNEFGAGVSHSRESSGESSGSKLQDDSKVSGWILKSIIGLYLELVPSFLFVSPASSLYAKIYQGYY